ncbi:MAG: hypothetical protein QW607_10875 [Desulfurococcaceae archaeon]
MSNDEKKKRKGKSARKRKVYTGRVKACWKVDPRYMMYRPRERVSQELYLCVTDMFRVVMLDTAIVPHIEYVPDGEVVDAPISYTDYQNKRICRLPVPGSVYSLQEFLEWVEPPCFIYPCTCYCTHQASVYSFAYPCSSSCRDSSNRCCFSSNDISCTSMPLWTGIIRLMYTKIKNYYTFRYLVCIGSTVAYVAPLPPPKSLMYLFDYISRRGLIDYRIYKYILSKYRNKIPNLLDFLTNGIFVDYREVFPDGVPLNIPMDGRYIFIDFNPKIVAFNYYAINKRRAHAVLIGWFDSNAKAYAVAKVAWEIKRDVFITLMRHFKPPRLVKDVEESFVNDVPFPTEDKDIDVLYDDVGGF